MVRIKHLSKGFYTGSLLIFFLVSGNLVSQNTGDSIKSVSPGEIKKTVPDILTPYHRNVVKINPTPMLIWSNIRNLTISYERLITKNQSLSLQVGYLTLPRLLGDTILSLVAVKSFERYGINLAFDYRYYPSSRNRRPAPDGLYVGSYISYYGYNFKNKMDILLTTGSDEASLKGKLEMLNLGIDLGYQFIFWKRFSLDLLLFGPSLTWYRTKLEFTGNLDPSQIEGIDQETLKDLIAQFPILGYIFKNHDVSYSSYNITTAFSFRYSVQLGFHF